MIIISDTNENFEIDRNVISVSGLLKDLLENNDENDESIPLPFKNILIEKMVEFCNYFYNDSNIYEEDNENEKTISNWYATFIDVDDEILFGLLRISDFLWIDPLIELCCVKIASIIKYKTLDELNERFNTDSHNTKEELIEFGV